MPPSNAFGMSTVTSPGRKFCEDVKGIPQQQAPVIIAAFCA
jgi:hypothetical protein